MSNFLRGFALDLVPRLVTSGKLEVKDGRTERAAAYLADHLAALRQGRSLLSSVEEGLLACPDVEEIYFDLDELKQIVEDLR